MSILLDYVFVSTTYSIVIRDCHLLLQFPTQTIFISGKPVRDHVLDTRHSCWLVRVSVQRGMDVREKRWTSKPIILLSDRQKEATGDSMCIYTLPQLTVE